jgi:predicted O-linked N-acetylglucosamine transferase (SPINDLY family)
MKHKLTSTTKPKSQLSTLSIKAQKLLHQAIWLHQQTRLEEAQEIYKLILKTSPKNFDALHLLGVAAFQTKHYQNAADLIAKAISVNPNNAASYNNRGNALKELGQLEAAVASYDLSLRVNPKAADAYKNRGVALQELVQLEAAVASYDKAIEYKTNYAEAYNNRGIALQQLNKLDAAMDSLSKAIEINPAYVEAYNNLGFLHIELKKIERALLLFEQALRIDPDHNYLLGSVLHARMNLCEWSNFDRTVAEMIGKIQSNAKVSICFFLLSLNGAQSVQRKVAEIYCQDKHPATAQPMWNGQRYDHKRIKLAYVSCDFKLHPATLNNIQMWEMHDRSRFEVIAISYGPVVQEDAVSEAGVLRARLVKAFDRFLDVGNKSDEQIAQLVRDMEVDIAVDISGVMQGGRPRIFAYKPVPVQVNLCGFTSGAPYIDYIIEDRVVIPPEHEVGYTEKVVCLPYARLPNDTTRQVSDRQFTRGELGLPEVGVVYCSFNNAYKFNPQMFDVWMRILQRVPGSVLWLQGGGQEKVKENLSKEASARGVDPTRLVFAHKIESMADHLARHRAADVFLDTLPFNAQTTAVDALWAGLPVLTCLGESAIGRTAGSVLMALGMDELVTTSLQDYEEQAVRIGVESGYAKSLKDKLERNRKEAPLFDTQRLTRNMESAYEQMHHRVQQGLEPQAFEVGAEYGA